MILGGSRYTPYAGEQGINSAHQGIKVPCSAENRENGACASLTRKEIFVSATCSNYIRMKIVKITGNFLGRNREICRAYQGNNSAYQGITGGGAKPPRVAYRSRARARLPQPKPRAANRTWPDALWGSRPGHPMFSPGLNSTRPCSSYTHFSGSAEQKRELSGLTTARRAVKRDADRRRGAKQPLAGQ